MVKGKYMVKLPGVPNKLGMTVDPTLQRISQA